MAGPLDTRKCDELMLSIENAGPERRVATERSAKPNATAKGAKDAKVTTSLRNTEQPLRNTNN